MTITKRPHSGSRRRIIHPDKVPTSRPCTSEQATGLKALQATDAPIVKPGLRSMRFYQRGLTRAAANAPPVLHHNVDRARTPHHILSQRLRALCAPRPNTSRLWLNRCVARFLTNAADASTLAPDQAISVQAVTATHPAPANSERRAATRRATSIPQSRARQ